MSDSAGRLGARTSRALRKLSVLHHPVAQRRLVQVQQRPDMPTSPELGLAPSASRSRYIRTARSRNSWSCFVGADTRLSFPC